jgi:hypothetical protein
MVEPDRAAGDPNTDEADEKQTADDYHFKLAVEIFLWRPR